MTAEVIIGNGFGIALAADEVTTVGRERTYSSASKVTGLPAPHALAVVHAGDVFLHGLPHDAMIADWVKSLPAQRLSTTQAYADSYVEFVQSRLAQVTEESNLTRSYLYHLEKMLKREIKNLSRSSEPTAKQLRQHFTMLRDRWKRPLTPEQQKLSDDVFRVAGRGSKNNLLEVMATEDAPELVGESSIEGVIDEALTAKADKRTLELAYEWARLKFGQTHPRMDMSGTLCFVGYGEKDTVPASTVYELEGFIAGHLYSRLLTSRSADQCSPSFILFEVLGQRQEIDRLIEQAGTSPSLNQDIVSEHLDGLEGKRLALGDVANKGLDEESRVDEEAEVVFPHEISEKINSRLSSVRQHNFHRFCHTAAGLNLPNLVSLAGRLVLLENLAHEIRGSMPTVGSKVVMATITQSEGFQWVKASVGDVA